MSYFSFKSMLFGVAKSCSHIVTHNKAFRISTALMVINGFSQKIDAHATPDLGVKLYHTPLDHECDKYDGVIISPETLPENKEDFATHLNYSLQSWKATGKRGIWLKIPSEKLEYAAPALSAGFVMHHAEKDYLMLTNWLSDDENKLPPNASHQIGVGCVVFNDEGKLLVVQEKNGPLKGMGVWKVPTGLVDAKEDLHIAAVREVKEETGIETEFVALLAFRHAHNFQFGKSDLFFVCLLKPLTKDIVKQENEIAACEFIELEKYTNQNIFFLSPLHTKLNSFILKFANQNKKNYMERFELPIGFRPGHNTLYIPQDHE